MPDRNSLSTNDALATMNDHLARFLQHADGLLKDWQAYGENLRASLDRQASDLNRTVAGAVQNAGREAAQAMGAGIESSLAESMAGLRRELDALTRAANQAQARVQAASGASAPARSAAAGAGLPPIAWAAMLSANVMLIALLVVTTRSCVKEGALQAGANTGQGAAVAVPVDAGVPGASCGEVVASLRARDKAADACAMLAQGYQLEAAKAFVGAAAAGLCEEAQAAPVTESLVLQLPEAAAPANAPKPDDKKQGEDEAKPSGGSGKKRSSRSGSSSKTKAGSDSAGDKDSK